MKTKSIVMALAILASSMPLFGQTTTVGNSTTSPTDYLGWDGFTGFDLDVKHEGNRNIIFSTSNTPQMGISSAGFVVSGVAAPIDNAKVSLQMGGSAQGKRALFGSSGQDMCAHFIADNANFNVGVGGRSMNASSSRSIGVWGLACSNFHQEVQPLHRAKNARCKSSQPK